MLKLVESKYAGSKKNTDRKSGADERGRAGAVYREPARPEGRYRGPLRLSRGHARAPRLQPQPKVRDAVHNGTPPELPEGQRLAQLERRFLRLRGPAADYS